jgi:hypothetical protein
VAGINLRRADFKSATCLNGYYSKRERRTGRHYPQRHVNRVMRLSSPPGAGTFVRVELPLRDQAVRR